MRSFAEILVIAGAAVALVLLILALVAPRLFGGKRRRAVIVFAVVLAVLAVVAVPLNVVPHYELTLASPDEPVVVGESEQLPVSIHNDSFSDATYEASFSLDGIAQNDIVATVAARSDVTVGLPLPADLAPGAHTVTLGDTSFAITALRPAKFVVRPFQVGPDLLKPGQRIRVAATVTNEGEVPGTFDGELRLNGRVQDEQPTDVRPGEAVDLDYAVVARSSGTCRVTLGGEQQKVVVVKPVRFANGDVIERHPAYGLGKLIIKNGKNKSDGVVVLTRTTSKSPLIAVYVRGRTSCTVSKIPDGSYRVYYWLGRDWNWYMHGFLTTVDRARFADTMAFSTRSWTNSWNDAYYRYTQRWVQPTGWTITLYGVTGGKGRTVTVSESGFPRVK